MKIRQPIITIAGHVDHGKCVSEDTLIPLVDGNIINARELFEAHFNEELAEKIDDGFLQNIESKNIEIFSFNGKNIIIKPISHIWKRKAEKLIEIRTSSGCIIKTTPEHPFFSFNLGILKETRADALREGQYIAVPKKIETKDSSIEEQIVKKIKNLDNFVCFLNINSGKFIDLLKSRNIAELERRLEIKHIGDSIKKLRFRIKEFFGLCSYLSIEDKDAYSMIDSIKNSDAGQRKGHTSNKIFLPKQGYEERLGYILGTLAGDGYISKNAILNNNDIEINQAYSLYLNQIFGTIARIKKAHTCNIVIDSGGLTFVRFLTEVIGFPKKNKSAEIFVPEIAKKNKEVFKGFFAGLFDTDGYVSHLNNSIEITSKSKKMIEDCSMLLLNFGIQSVVYEKNGFYVLRIANKIYLELFFHFFNSRLQRKRQRVLDALEKAQSSRVFDFFPLNGDILRELKVSGKINRKVPYFNKYQKLTSLSSIFLSQIMKNLKQENQTSALIKQLLEQEVSYVKVTSKRETLNSHGWVYDFTIPETHNFVAERVLVHNTTILDSIRKTMVAEGEAGGITQKISFTLFPADKILARCPIIEKQGIKLDIPGFLFIDTPGHAAFTNLRKRGGSLADLAILVIDINEGIKPQTAEVIEILKLNKTPFLVALNKIDHISGWRKQDENLKDSIEMQSINTKQDFDEKLYMLQGSLHSHGFNADLYYNVQDFTAKLALVPCSGKTGEGIPELLMMLCGLSQKFLKGRLALGKQAKGVILEVKKQKAINYAEAILYDGILSKNDEIAVASFGNPIKSKIRILEQVLPLSSKFKPSPECTAATGVRMQLTSQEVILSGMPFQTFIQEQELRELNKEITESIRLDKQGIIIKADSLGSLEALIILLKQEKIKVSKAGIGNISKADILSAKANIETNPLDAVILGFNIQEDEEAKETDKSGIKILEEEVIYKLIENLQKFRDEKTQEIQREKLMMLASLCKLKILPQYVFHNSNPAVFGVRVEGGKLKQGIELINQDGEKIAKIKAVQSEGKSIDEAKLSQEVAISLPGVNFERQLKDVALLFSDIGEAQFREFKSNKELLSSEEISVLQEIARIKRKQKPTWGV